MTHHDTSSAAIYTNTSDESTRAHSTLMRRAPSDWYKSKWSEFIKQQNLGVVVPPGSGYYVNAAFQVVDPKQFLMTSIRLGLQYEDVPTTPLQVTH